MAKLNYSVSQSKYKETPEVIRDEYELQYNKEHIVEKVKVGETDLIKEVDSHVNEVGLINVVRLAIARGEDPSIKFAKDEPGIMAAIDPNASAEEISEYLSSLESKYSDIAQSLGVSVEELKASLGDQSKFEALIASSKKEEVVANEQ